MKLFVALGFIALLGTFLASEAYTSPYQLSPGVNYVQTAAPSYSLSCGTLGVTQVLDQIYCHHGHFTRFTSTDLAAIKVALYQLNLVTKFAHIQSVLEYVEQAIRILESLKDETYKPYDTSLLSKVYNIADPIYLDPADTIQNHTASLDFFESMRRKYINTWGMLTWGTFIPDPFVTNYTTHASPYFLQPNSEYDNALDSACFYITASYCSTTSSILIKNTLYRILITVKSIIDALTILEDYLTNHDCGTDNDNKYALLVTVDTYGSVLGAASVLLEAAKYEYSLYLGMSAGAGSYTSNIYGRASSSPYGGSSAAAYQRLPYQVQTPIRYQRAVVPVIVG